MTNLKWEVKENVSEYLEKLDKQMADDMDYILNHVADQVTGTNEDDSAPIPSLMSTTFNPYLYISGQEKHNRFTKHEKDFSEIEILYSGMELEEYAGDEALVWWEFAEDPDEAVALPPRQRHLDRDYAYFQETGMDEIAKRKDAKHIGAVRIGLIRSTSIISRETARQIELVFGRI